jgi:Protein of unknown function (DUF 659)
MAGDDTPHDGKQRLNNVWYEYQALYQQLKRLRSRAISSGSPRWWQDLDPVLEVDEDGATTAVRLKCGHCHALLSAGNPSDTAKTHGVMADGCVRRKPSVSESSGKRPRGMDGYVVRCPPAAAHTAREELALFFYTNNVALQLVEDPHLVAAFKAMGADLPSRKVLSTTELDKVYKQQQQQLTSTLEASPLINLATDGWKSKSAGGGAPLLNCMVLQQEGGSRFFDVVDTSGNKKDAAYLATLHLDLLDRASGGNQERQNSLVMDNTKANRAAMAIIKAQRPNIITLGCTVSLLQNNCHSRCMRRSLTRTRAAHNVRLHAPLTHHTRRTQRTHVCTHTHCRRTRWTSSSRTSLVSTRPSRCRGWWPSTTPSRSCPW